MKENIDNPDIKRHNNGEGEKVTNEKPVSEVRDTNTQENDGEQTPVVLFGNVLIQRRQSVKITSEANDGYCANNSDQVEDRIATSIPDSTLHCDSSREVNNIVIRNSVCNDEGHDNQLVHMASESTMNNGTVQENVGNMRQKRRERNFHSSIVVMNYNIHQESGKIHNEVKWKNDVDILGLKLERGDPPYGPGEKWRIIRNVVFLSMAFMIHFTAFVGATNLQSSINAAEGLGTVSLASVYATLILSTIFLPAVMIKWLGCKGALLAAFVSYMPYIAAQFSASYYTVMPTAILVGLGGGPFWCAQCMYLCVVSDVYAKITSINTEVIVVRFFGIFYMIYEFGQIFGNIISSTVLSSGWDDGHWNTSLDLDVRDICGANFCPGNDALANPNLQRPSDVKIYTIAGIYLGCMALSCLVLLLGVDSLTRYNEAELAAKDPPATGLELLRAAGRLLRDRNQTLLVPLTVWLGLEKAVIAADYTASYVSCAWGIRNIGYVMVCYGVANSLSAMVGGWLVKLTGRTPVVLSAAVLHVAILATLLLWRPHPQDGVVFFVMAGLWGAADGVWNVQVNALCGILSPGNEKAAYSSFRLWESVGYILAYGWSAYLCTDVKLYVVLALLLLGMAGYLAIELGLRTKYK